MFGYLYGFFVTLNHKKPYFLFTRQKNKTVYKFCEKRVEK
jgi:hypothetical protein